jgi:hypothetical protein
MLSQTVLKENSLYTLKTQKSTDAISLSMKIDTNSCPSMYTRDFPHTTKVLQQYYPDVFYTSCFNQKNLPFAEEVKDTELAHLFEHILIQKMTDFSRHESGIIIYDGWTTWDWYENEVGTFNITISSINMDVSNFYKAIEPSIALFNKIIDAK